jgi:hypothetical protein
LWTIETIRITVIYLAFAVIGRTIIIATYMTICFVIVDVCSIFATIMIYFVIEGDQDNSNLLGV